MDEDDLVLVIDLDDEREEKRYYTNHRNYEIQSLDQRNVDKHTANQEKRVIQNSDGVNLTINRGNRNEHDNDDDVLVMDNGDDDYEHSVQKFVYSANKIGKEYRKSKHDEVEEQKMRPEVYDTVKHGNVARFFNPGAYKEQTQVNHSNKKQKLLHDTNENHQDIRGRTTCEMSLSERRYSKNDLQYLGHQNDFRQSREREHFRFERTPHAQTRVDFYKPDVSSINEYHTAIKMSKRNRTHRPDDISRHDKCANDAIHRAACIHSHRPENVYNTDDYGRNINRDITSNTHRPDITSNVRDYGYNSNYRTKNEHTFVPNAISAYDHYERAATNKDLYNISLRPEIASRYNDYRTTAISDCSLAFRPNSISNRDCLLRQNDMTRVHLNNAYADALDDYWYTITNRHTYKPDLVAIDEYGRAIIRRNAYDTLYGIPPIGMDPYRSDLAHIYRPELDNIDIYRETMLQRNSCYPERVGLDNYSPEVSYTNAYIPNHDETCKINEEILNLSRKKESNDESTKLSTKQNNLDHKKLRTILSTDYQENTVPLSNSRFPDAHKSEHKRNIQCYKITTDTFAYGETVKSMNSSEEPMSNVPVLKPGVSITMNRPETVILGAKDACTKTISNTPVQTDSFSTAILINSHSQTNGVKSTKTAKDNKTVSSYYSQKHHFLHNINKIHEETHTEVVGDRDVSEVVNDTNIQFLVVFFTRVKELVKETFPEFFKSLEREIDNLGQVTNAGKIKTDIQFICPLYCSVSTYSLPHFGSFDTDNKIEKHVNRAKICDVCSCIQRCYKLYKKKYLISAANERNEITHGQKRKITDPQTMDTNIGRTETVIRRRSGNYEENSSMCHKVSSTYSNTGESLQQGLPLSFINTQEAADNVTENPSIRFDTNALLDSLSIQNFNAPNHNATNNKDNDSIQNTNKMNIDNYGIDNNDKTMSDSGNIIDKDRYPRDDAEANLILSLSYNEITNADIISSKLKNKSGRKPDAVFTCHICSCMFTYFTSFVSHMQKEHGINGIDEEIPDECIARKCPFCGIYSKQKYHNDHVKRAHPQIYTHKGEPSDIQIMKVDTTKRKSKKRKFIFTCLVCHKNLKSSEVKRHREKEHKGLNVAKMFTKKLTTLD